MTKESSPAESSEEGGFVYDELIPEWQDVVDELRTTNKGREYLRRKDLKIFIPRNSDDLKLTQQQYENGEIDFEELEPYEVEDLYYKHASIINMAGRIALFESIAERLQTDIDNDIFEPEKLPFKQRWLANIYEEVSTVSLNGNSSELAHEAFRLNTDVSNSPLLEYATSPRKVHADLSLYDIGLRSLFFSPQIFENHEIVQEISEEERIWLAEGIQTNFYQQIYNVAEASFPGNEPQATDGSIGEGLVVGASRDRVIDLEKLGVIEVSSSFLRQDHTYANYENVNQKKNNGKRKDKEISGFPRLSFDFVVKNHETGKTIPVEVKKRVGKGPRKISQPNLTPEAVNHRYKIAKSRDRRFNYLPVIEVIKFRLGKNREQYLEEIKLVCAGRIAELTHETPSKEQLNALSRFRKDVNPQIDEVIRKSQMLN